MDEDESRYRIKTTEGYYYATGGGRYGRFDGRKLWAWVFCWEHAHKLVQWVNDTSPQLKAVEEKFPGHTPCQQCLRE